MNITNLLEDMLNRERIGREEELELDENFYNADEPVTPNPRASLTSDITETTFDPTTIQRPRNHPKSIINL